MKAIVATKYGLPDVLCPKRSITLPAGRVGKEFLSKMNKNKITNK